MSKYISALILFFTPISGKAQTFSYSQNYLANKTSACKIIGQVKNNIIVWYVSSEKYKKSVILVYNNRMKLIKKVTTDILHSDIDPAASFYNSVDSFYVAYQYKKGNKWEYKLAGFDNDGNLSSTYLIDSASNLNSGDSLSYSFYQSGDKKTLGCVKTIMNKKYNAIRFELTFLNDGNLYRDHFFLAFDNVHEKLVDLLIDSNKTISLLKTSNTDSGFSISLIKKEFSADHFLIATKKLAAGNLRNGTSHFFNRANSYTIYGIWENAFRDSLTRNQKYKTGLYTWKVDDKLADMADDSILYDDSTTILEYNLYASNSLTNKPNNFFGIQTDSINISNQYAIPPTSMLVYTNFGTTGTWYYNYIDSNTSLEPPVSHYKASLTIISLNNNDNMEWRIELKNDRDSVFLNDPSNNKIVAGKKGIHIIRSTTIKKTRNSIKHILITYSGRYEKVNTVVWNNKYSYLVSQAVETNDGALIIPCLKDNRLIFARMILE